MVVPEDGEPDEPIRLGVRRALRVTRALGRAARGQESQVEPGVVLSGPRIEALAERARSLATAGREDAEAVSDLQVAAGRHSKDLGRAAALVRLEESVSESRVAHRASRLLLAAATRSAVEPVSDEEEQWFRQIDSIDAVPLDVGFARLREVLPALGELEREARSVSAETGRAAETDAWWDDLCDRIADVLGPTAQITEPLLRTETAYGIARVHLGEIAGTLDVED